MSYSPPFTASKKEEVVKKYKAGKTLEELADSFKCSTAKVRRVLLDAKVAMRPRGPKGDPSKPKAKKVKAKKPKAKKVSKPKKAKSKVKAKAKKPKLISKGSFAKYLPKPKGKKTITAAQRDAKNKADRDRRASKKSGLNKVLADAAAAAGSNPG